MFESPVIVDCCVLFHTDLISHMINKCATWTFEGGIHKRRSFVAIRRLFLLKKLVHRLGKGPRWRIYSRLEKAGRNWYAGGNGGIQHLRTSLYSYTLTHSHPNYSTHRRLQLVRSSPAVGSWMSPTARDRVNKERPWRTKTNNIILTGDSSLSSSGLGWKSILIAL